MASPTIVLVHGAFGDATAWHPVLDALRGAGYGREIRAPANGLRDAEPPFRVVDAVAADR
jgi:pimeloyl-ACP methyl ester carboxylesterase